MTYDVLLSPIEQEVLIKVDAASPQLAAMQAQKTIGAYFVTSVNGVACLGKCERCSRHVMETDKNKFAVESGVMCGLCVSELDRGNPKEF